jgi:hypothetical protein
VKDTDKEGGSRRERTNKREAKMREGVVSGEESASRRERER